MLYGDGTFDTSYYGLTVPYLYHFENDDTLGLFGINLGKLFKGAVGVVAGFIPGGSIAVDIATGLIPGGSQEVPNSGGRTAGTINKDLADQARYFQLAAAGDTFTRVEGGMTALARLIWEASPANSGNPYEVNNARVLLQRLAASRTDVEVVPTPGTPRMAGLPAWVLPAAIGAGALLFLRR